MKKILFSAIAICGMIAANAQTVLPSGSQTAVSTNTNTLAGSVTSDFELRIKMHNIIRIVPNDNMDLVATFNSSSDLDGGLNLSTPLLGLPGVAFIVSSNRDFHVNMSTPNANVTGTNIAPGSVGNNSMPISKFKFKTTAISSGLTLAAGVGSYGSLATSQALVTNGDYGALRSFGLQFRCEPGWDYEGGNYVVPITITATQD